MLLEKEVNRDMKELLNQRASQLKKQQNQLNEQLEAHRNKASETAMVIDLEDSWKNADYECRKRIAMLMIHQITVSEDGNVSIVWNL
jgi:hypothetical protein